MLQRRLRGLSNSQRNGLGLILVAAGSIGLVVGVLFTHYSNFPEAEQVDVFGWIPRACIMEGPDWCLPWYTLGHLIAFGASQILLAGVAVLFFLEKKMTWARASFAAFIVFLELVLLLGTVPSEWLNLTQGPLGWTEQNDAFGIWPPLMLGNEVGISWGFVKDFVSINYNMAALTGLIIVAYRLQDWGKPLEEEDEAEVISPYGRPLVKGAN